MKGPTVPFGLTKTWSRYFPSNVGGRQTGRAPCPASRSPRPVLPRPARTCGPRRIPGLEARRGLSDPPAPDGTGAAPRRDRVDRRRRRRRRRRPSCWAALAATATRCRLQTSELPHAMGSRSVRSCSGPARPRSRLTRSEEHTSELQSLAYLVCRLLLEKKNHL